MSATSEYLANVSLFGWREVATCPVSGSDTWLMSATSEYLANVSHFGWRARDNAQHSIFSLNSYKQL